MHVLIKSDVSKSANKLEALSKQHRVAQEFIGMKESTRADRGT